jgi:hypothetical protein
MQQQSRKDDWIRQMIQVFLMTQQQGQKQENWERSQEQREKYQQGTLDYYEHLKKPKPEKPPQVPEKMQLANLLMKYRPDSLEGKAIRKAYNIKTPADEAKAMETFKEKERFKANLPAKPSTLSEGGKAVQARWEADKLEKAAQAKLTQDANFMKKAITRFTKERERMFTALGKLTDKKQVREQEANIAHVDQAVSILDSIDAQLRGGQPLPPAAYDKAADILANMKSIRQGLYDFETGEIVPTVSEKAVPKELRQNIVVNDQTGERKVFMDGQWYKILKNK